MVSLRVIDDAARFFLDPSNHNYSAPKKAAAWITTVLLCFATLGTVQLFSAVWRSCRQIQEKNDTHEKISGIFHRVFSCQKSERNDEKFFKDSSRYVFLDHQRKIGVNLIKRGIPIIPEFHLLKLTEAIKECIAKNQQNPLLLVELLQDNGEFSVPGFDAGGLSRDYLDALAEGIAHSTKNYFKIITSTGLAIPQARQKDKTDGELSALDEQEASIYNALGALMMFCYRSKSNDVQNKTYLLGRYFDEAIFSAALSLTAEELDTPFENLSFETLLKMSRAILFAQNGSGDAMASQMENWLKLLQKFDSLSAQKLEEAAQIMANLCLLPEEFQMEGQEDVPDFEKINNHLPEFKNSFRKVVFSQDTSFGRLENLLAPIHAIACGMKSICSKTANNNYEWDAYISACQYFSFSTKIQGSLDRFAIVNQMELDFDGSPSVRNEISKKVEWLKEWITDETTTEKEVKKFLKFLTGSSSFPAGKPIYVLRQRPEDGFIPIPRVHTCSLAMELAPRPSSYGKYNDFTKEAFIQALRDLVLTSNDHSYQMD